MKYLRPVQLFYFINDVRSFDRKIFHEISHSEDVFCLRQRKRRKEKTKETERTKNAEKQRKQRKVDTRREENETKNEKSDGGKRL